MPLQNRVTPFGDLVALPGRGLVLGNRGVLHDDARRIVRPWQVRRWIACRIEFRGRRRPIMRPRTWTELFFLDEATAFAAGHRPCAACRFADYRRFRALWEACGGATGGADAIDRQLDAERRDRRTKRSHRTSFDGLPDGTFVALDGGAWLVAGSWLFAWSDSGYTGRRARPRGGEAEILTPRTIVAVLAAGYRAEIHPSAEATR